LNNHILFTQVCCHRFSVAVGQGFFLSWGFFDHVGPPALACGHSYPRAVLDYSPTRSKWVAVVAVVAADAGLVRTRRTALDEPPFHRVARDPNTHLL
jgi:hypothetical protein|tara:strand:- start:220 stop:510 length:291 start_codon:yes stop_codon:yes gene_type:complete